MAEQQTVVIVGAKRTPIGSFQGQFAPLSAVDLGAAAIAGAVEHAGIDAADLNEVTTGFTKNNKYDIEFTGGTSVQINLKEDVSLSRQDVQDRIVAIGSWCNRMRYQGVWSRARDQSSRVSSSWSFCDRTQRTCGWPPLPPGTRR